ncbi:ABC transporter ATP-binding protein [Nitratidesulfovibrio sp. SRB-5]|uniref:ABC transporter ATP-binding protein n=1 Tax=Nitratidesulfovibrio sp. SRB-5 TaxID=2872636 RepID=UPI001CBA5F2A|nr:oligopeptide/dipeptide ABC transporter ATP-binding protein [Nitratidesulfovibrio sp. SRB-5]
MFDPTPAVLRAVDGVSLTLDRGRTLGLVGESGCGKSTLARMVVGLLPPSAGQVLLDGRLFAGTNAATDGGTGNDGATATAAGPASPAISRAEAAQLVQMVFQDPFSSLNPRRTVGASIGEALAVAGVPGPERRAKVADMLQLVGLRAEHADRYPHEFSGGQRQRVAVARALITHPALVVCDEPVSSLDASVQAQVLNLLRELQEHMGLAYLFISHDLGVVGHMSDHVAVMYLGKVVEQAPRDVLFAAPAHPYTRALLASVPVRDPSRRAEHPALSGDLPSPIAPPPGCPFHPRCPQVMDVCRRQVPGWHVVAEGQHARCHLHAPELPSRATV